MFGVQIKSDLNEKAKWAVHPPFPSPMTKLNFVVVKIMFEPKKLQVNDLFLKKEFGNYVFLVEKIVKVFVRVENYSIFDPSLKYKLLLFIDKKQS